MDKHTKEAQTDQIFAYVNELIDIAERNPTGNKNLDTREMDRVKNRLYDFLDTLLDGIKD